MKKIISITVLFVCMFFLCNNLVKAESWSNKENWDLACIDDGTCLALCAYQNKQTKKSADGHTYSMYFGVYIYYHFKSGEMEIRWDKQPGWDTSNKMETRYYKPGGDIPNETFIQPEAASALSTIGACPINGYVDFGGGNNEVCLDNNTTYCKDDSSGWATTFAPNSSTNTYSPYPQYEYSRLYDYNEHIQIYFNEHAPSITSCQELEDKTFDLSEIFTTDFSKNFLNGYPLPDFIKNSNIFKDGLKSMKTKQETFTQTCIDAVCDDPSKNEEECETAKEKYIAGYEKVISQIDDAYSIIMEGTIQLGNVNCNDIFRGEFGKLIQDILNIIKFLAPVLVIVLSTVDYLKAVASQDKDELKKASKTAAKRFLIAVALFFIPIIINLLLSYFGDISTCGIG